MTIHFLHIGKTGGTAIKAALRPYAQSHDLRLNKHDRVLSEVPRGDKALFSVREPIGRFVSSFNSRLRKGMPHVLREWSEGERIAFDRFPTPNALAEGLTSEDAATQEAARDAMSAIQHVRAPLSRWIGSTADLEARSDDVLFVISQPELRSDFEIVRRLIGLPAEAALPGEDEVAAHRTPAGFDTTLSPLGRRNIADWYAADAELYEACLAFRARRLESLRSPAPAGATA